MLDSLAMLQKQSSVTENTGTGELPGTYPVTESIFSVTESLIISAAQLPRTWKTVTDK
jgi:hypothetical protein